MTFVTKCPKNTCFSNLEMVVTLPSVNYWTQNTHHKTIVMMISYYKHVNNISNTYVQVCKELQYQYGLNSVFTLCLSIKMNVQILTFSKKIIKF